MANCKTTLDPSIAATAPEMYEFLQDNCEKIISTIDVELREYAVNDANYTYEMEDLLKANSELVAAGITVDFSSYVTGFFGNLVTNVLKEYNVGESFQAAFNYIEDYYLTQVHEPGSLSVSYTADSTMYAATTTQVNAELDKLEKLCNPDKGEPMQSACDMMALLESRRNHIMAAAHGPLETLAKLRSEWQKAGDRDETKGWNWDVSLLGDEVSQTSIDNAKKWEDAHDIHEAGVGQVAKTPSEVSAPAVEAQVQYREQCYLLARVLNLAEYKKDFLEVRHAKRLPYHVWDADSPEQKDNSPRNASLLVHGDPYAFMNELTQYSNYNAFFNMTNAEISSLVPMIRLFKVVQNYQGEEMQTEYNFDSYATEGNIESLLADKKKRGFGVGIKDFSFTYDGSNPFAVKKSIKAKLTLFANSFDELLEPRMNKDAQTYRYADLALKTGGEKMLSSARLSEQAQANLSKLNFRLKAVVGWALPNGASPLSAEAQDAVNNSFVTLNLTPTVHDFNIDEIGRVTFVINYLAYIEDFFDHPIFNIFANPNSTNVDGSVYNIFTRQLMRRMVVRHLQEECETEKISALEEKFANRVAAEKVKSLSFITQRMIDWGNIRYINIPRKDLQAFLEEGPFYEESTGSFAQQISTTATDKGLANKLDSAYQKVVGSEESDENKKYTFSRLMLDPNSEQIPFFYVSDLVDTLLVNIDMTLDRAQGAMATEYKNISKNFGKDITVSQDAVNQELSNLAKYHERFKKFRVLLGPVEIVSTKKGGASKIVNLGDIPVSLKYFAEWLTNQLLKKDEVLYPLSKFLNDFLNNLIRNFLNDDTCFKVSNKQHVRLHQAALTSYKNTDSDYDEVTELIVNSEETGAKEKQWQYSRLVLANVDQRPILNISGMRDFALTQKRVQEENNWIVYYAGRTQPTELMTGDRETDEKRGIFHYGIGRDRGLVKTISLSKTQSKYLQVVRFEQNGFDGLEQLRPVYDVNVDAFPIVNAFPGTYIFVDPRGWAPNTAPFGTTKGFDLTKLGIGGYHMIIRSEHNFGMGLAESKITAKWVAQIDYEEEAEAEAAGGDQLPAKCRSERDARATSVSLSTDEAITAYNKAKSAAAIPPDTVAAAPGDPSNTAPPATGESAEAPPTAEDPPTTPQAVSQTQALLEGGVKICWVARVVIPERWKEARTYVMYLSPRWFYRLYRTYGERIADFIENKPFLQRVLRPLFLKFADKGSAYEEEQNLKKRN